MNDNEVDPRVIAQIAVEQPDALLRRLDGRWTLRMSRYLPHPPARVWPMLTEPTKLMRWSPVIPDRAFDSVGPATSREGPDAAQVSVEVLVHEPPRELVHRWADQVLHWTLTPERGGTRLQLQHTFDQRPEAGSFAAGWHVCLATLALVSEGCDVERVVGARALDYGWADMKDGYDRLLR